MKEGEQVKDNPVNVGTKHSSGERVETAGEAPDLQPCAAGRELDALMAEHVMGWKRVHSDRDEGDDRKEVAWMLLPDRVLKGEPYTYSSMGGLYDRAFAKWSPSTDIAAAMEVAIKMRELDFTVEVGSAIGGRWYASFDDYEEAADTIPEAICRCALIALQATNTSAADGTADQD
jgi:hypothetical protein